MCSVMADQAVRLKQAKEMEGFLFPEQLQAAIEYSLMPSESKK